MSQVNVVEAEGLEATLGGRKVLKDVTFAIQGGKFTGLIGPNGAGKSTLLRILLGLIEPSGGKVEVFGHTPGESHNLIGYVPQGGAGNDDMFPVSVRDVVNMGRLGRTRMGRYYGAEDMEAVYEAMESAGVADLAEKRFGALSGGERQKALIARALCGGPKLLLLDEPTTGVDIASEESFYDMLTNLRERYKMTILLVSHDIGVVSSLVDEILCLNQTLFVHGPPGEAGASDWFAQAYGGGRIVNHAHHSHGKGQSCG